MDNLVLRVVFQNILFNIMLIIFKKNKTEKNAKICHFHQFFACRNQNDDYLCSLKFQVDFLEF